MAKAVSLKLEDADRERLTQLAAKTRRTPHYLMREAVLSFLDREEKRIAFREEAEAAWTDYKETGFHLTLDDMESWAKAKSPAPLRQWRK